MMDQAEILRQLVKDTEKNVNKKSRIITITSGKGGVGKSNFVVNLAITLKNKGKSVLIFDGDIGMGNDDVLMGIYPKYNVMDVIKGEVSIKEAIIISHFGVELLPGGTGLNNIEDISEEERERFIKEIEMLEGYDYILIDTGAGINRSVLAFIASSEEVIFIVTPEPTSLTDGYSLLKAIKHFKIITDVKVVVNRIVDNLEGTRTFEKFNGAAERFLNVTTTYLGAIDEDRKLTMAVRNQTPLVMQYPTSNIVKAIDSIANKIIGQESKSTKNGMKVLFNKLFNIFS